MTAAAGEGDGSDRAGATDAVAAGDGLGVGLGFGFGVAVVAVARLTVPFRIVTVPQVRARTGTVLMPMTDATSAPTRARPAARHALEPRPGAAARRPNPWAMLRG
jgi:hypothetical protein